MKQDILPVHIHQGLLLAIYGWSEVVWPVKDNWFFKYDNE